MALGYGCKRDQKAKSGSKMRISGKNTPNGLFLRNMEEKRTASDRQPAIGEKLAALGRELKGELYDDKTMRTLYATDASAYREMPLAVAVPKNVEDIQKLIEYAHTERLSLIPRTAGTSLAGQVVGKGIVVDVSKYFTKILELNAEERWVRVQPGVIRDDLNLF